MNNSEENKCPVPYIKECPGWKYKGRTIGIAGIWRINEPVRICGLPHPPPDCPYGPKPQFLPQPTPNEN